MASNRKQFKRRSQIRINQKIECMAVKNAFKKHFSENMKIAVDKFAKMVDLGRFIANYPTISGSSS